MDFPTSFDTPPKTYTAAGYARAQEHELIVDELCDLYMIARLVSGADDRGSEQTHVRAERVVTNMAKIIDKLQAWEKANLGA